MYGEGHSTIGSVAKIGAVLAGANVGAQLSGIATVDGVISC